jgi:hypothetical protein
MSRLILIAAALLAAPVAAQTSPAAPDTTPNATENQGADAGTAGSDMSVTAGKPAKAKAKHKSHATDTATGNRAPIDTSAYLPTTQSPY